MKNNACVRLTQKTAKALIQRELNLSASRLKKERAKGGVYIYKMTLGRFEITVENDWFERNGLYVLEISSGTGEAMRLYADGEACEKYERRKPEGVAVELADCMIRILDYCGRAGIDIEEAIRIKHEYNKTRPYRHGGKKC